MKLRQVGEMELNIGRYFFGRILLAVSGFLTIPLLIRALGVTGYGQVSLWIVIAYWLPMLLGGWIQQSILRYHREYQLSNSYSDYKRTSESATNRVAMACGILTFVTIHFVSSVTVLEQTVLALFALCAVQNTVRAAVAQAEGAASLIVRGDLARTAIPMALFAIHFSLFGPLSRATALIYFLVGLLAANWVLSRQRSMSDSARAEFSALILRRMLVFGLPMGLWLALSASQVLAGRFALQIYHQQQGLGVYTAVQDFFTKSGTALFMPVTYALHSQVMSLWAEQDYLSARRTIRNAYVYQLLLGAVILIAVFFGHHLFSRIVFGRGSPTGNLVGGPFLLVMTAAVILGNFGLIAHKGMEIGERTTVMVLVLLLAVAINFTTSILLLPTLGAWGVAYGMLAGNACYLAMTHLLSQRVLNIAEGAA